MKVTLVEPNIGRMASGPNAVCIAAPVAGYVAWYYWRTGESGLKSFAGAA